MNNKFLTVINRISYESNSDKRHIKTLKRLEGKTYLERYQDIHKELKTFSPQELVLIEIKIKSIKQNRLLNSIYKLE